MHHRVCGVFVYVMIRIILFLTRCISKQLQLFQIGTKMSKLCVAIFFLGSLLLRQERQIADGTAQVKPLVWKKEIF